MLLYQVLNLQWALIANSLPMVPKNTTAFMFLFVWGDKGRFISKLCRRRPHRFLRIWTCIYFFPRLFGQSMFELQNYKYLTSMTRNAVQCIWVRFLFLCCVTFLVNFMWYLKLKVGSQGHICPVLVKCLRSKIVEV